MSISSLLKQIVGSRNERTLKRCYKAVACINQLEPQMQKLSKEEFIRKTEMFKQQYQQNKNLDDLLIEAFALVREVAKRSLNMRHFDVQLIGGMVLHEGKIAEMRTGEGKTLVSSLPAYLNALSGKNVHIVTVNDYLAERDAKWMRSIYEAVGMRVGVIKNGMTKEAKQNAYACEVVYGTNNEFGFDYLRDNMTFSSQERMQSELAYVIVDEADSIFIDEARTPLIISGQEQDSLELYIKINQLIPKLNKQENKYGPGDYSIDEKNKQVFLTEDGYQKVEDLMQKEGLLQNSCSLYDADSINLIHHMLAALKAHAIFKKNVDYIVKNGKIVIVDEHTGRTMEGRRWSDGVHQAIEAKEHVTIESENQILASITFQNYFRLYNKLAGMTGTADTEAYELQQIYNLEVVVIPTNKPCLRKDEADLIYMTTEEKFDAIIEDILNCVKRKQPVLVGTISIETSEYLSSLLKARKINHRVLNAKYHEKEAQIIAEAGRLGSVTIATNMAGRGTDIVLGGSLDADLENSYHSKEKSRQIWQKKHDEVIKAGGLRIIGTERHESRRIDNQLRGRAARQGDPGSTQFYLSLRDPLMRIFISERISVMLNKLGMKKGEVIMHPWVSKAVENAQRKVEGHNFDIRKQLLEFDNVANEQRRVIYTQRNELMNATDVQKTISLVRYDVIKKLINKYIPYNTIEEQWNIVKIEKVMQQYFGFHLPIRKWLNEADKITQKYIQNKITKYLEQEYKKKEAKLGPKKLRFLEKTIMLNVIDMNWKEHLANMDQLRQSIHLRSYAQKNPKREYQRESFMLFTEMLDSIKFEITTVLSRLDFLENDNVKEVEKKILSDQLDLKYYHKDIQFVEHAVKDHEKETKKRIEPFVRQDRKVGRNELCYCGSGKKFKQCHGKIS